MSDNIVSLSVTTKLPIEPDRVLESAKGKLSEAIVLGWLDGELYIAASDPDMSRAAMLLLKALNVVTEAA